MVRTCLRLAVLTIGLVALGSAASPIARAEHDAKIQVLLLGDSTTIGSICRKVQPSGPHLEDVIRLLLAAEKDLPPVNVINQGRDGEFIHGLLSGGRYQRDIAKLPGIDYVFIRYGLNDQAKREDFTQNFPKDFRDLISRLRHDLPDATLVPTSTIPYLTFDKDAQITALIRQVAEEEKLPYFDLYTRYQAELSHGDNMLNYRRYPLEKIPEPQRSWVQPFVINGAVVVMDNRLDAHFRELPGWFGDRHPNLAGYHVIGDETARFLAKQIRTSQGLPK